MRKTVARLERRYPGVIEDVSHEGIDGHWLYLSPGWIRGDVHMVHEWNARDLIQGMREVRKCECSECQQLIAQRKRAGVDPNDRAAARGPGSGGY